jgi:hypothetical protein
MRSNRLHTQQAVYAVKGYLDGLFHSKKEFGNTSVQVLFDAYQKDIGLLVSIHGKPILRLVKNGRAIDAVYVFSGFYYDRDGNPSRTTGERLNGLLDALGELEVIPKRIRLIKDREYNLSFIGQINEAGPTKVRAVLNQNYSDVVEVTPDPERFVVKNAGILALADLETCKTI